MNPSKTKVYAIATQWPGTQLILESAPNLSPGAIVTMLGSSGELQWEANAGGGLKITVPSPTENISKWAWAFVLNLQ